MFDKLATVESRYDELMTRLGTVEVQSDAGEYTKAAKALAELEPLVQKYREYKTVEEDLAGTTELAKGADAEMRALADEELPALGDYERTMSVALNTDYSRMTATVHEGDEVAFLPPVSGG